MKIDLKLFSIKICLAVLSVLLLHACNAREEATLPANADTALLTELNEPYQPFEPELGAAVPNHSEPALKSAALPYPPFNPHDIKVVGPGGWRDRDQLLDTGIGGVKFNLIWSQWQPDPNLKPGAPNTFTYDGKVWLISAARESEIRWYSERGMKVTAVLYGTPAWARPKNTARFANNVTIIDDKFIAPDNPADFARFAGMLAKRFNGANGNGRIVNFVIQNEVNALDWYNPGCGADTSPCKIEDRIDSYATLFNQSYDKIVAEQPHAKVMYSFDHHFGMAYADNPRYTSAQRFIEALEPKVGDRRWRIAFHSYPPDLFRPAFGPYDYPKITFGNLGILASYLRQNFPTKPYTWDIHLTENGINSSTPSSQREMQSQLKVATRNIIGTPGIETFYYHRLKDHRDEGSFTPGLFNANQQPKLAWQNWSTNNLPDARPASLDDGYEDLPYIRLQRSAHPLKGHWASTRQAPAGYTAEASYLLLREPEDNTTLLYECHDNSIHVTYISAKLYCGGDDNFGPVGYIYNNNNSNNNRRPLYTIKLGNKDYVVSYDANEGGGEATLLGFVDSAKVRKQDKPARNPSYFDTSAQNTPQSSNDSSTETVLANWENCVSDEKPACQFIKFTSQPNQSHTLSCRNGSQIKSSIILSYGNNETSSLLNITNSGGNTATYTIPLIIDDDATWASVTLHGDSATQSCVVLSAGGLQIGAASNNLSGGLLYNGSFESRISDWKFCQPHLTHITTDNVQHGSRAIELNSGDCLYQEIEIVPEASYRASCFAKTESTDHESDLSSLRLAMANSSYQTLSESKLSIQNINWQQYATTLQAPQQSKYAVLSVESTAATSIDNCSITQVSGN